MATKPWATLLLGDSETCVDWFHANATHFCFDPPYGIGYQVRARADKGRGNGLRGTAYPETLARPSIPNDDRPFDPRPWVHPDRPVACFGANYYADRLPTDRQWVLWDKRDGSASDDHSDGEMVWLSTKGPLRIHRQKWRGVVRAGEENASRSKKLHPNQKPVALLTRLLGLLDVRADSIVADPYMGSGSTGVAALRMGAYFIGCEVDPTTYAIAVSRIRAEGYEVFEDVL